MIILFTSLCDGVVMTHRKEDVLKSFRASAAKLITDNTWETNWSIISSMFMFSEEATNTYRLYRSQSFEDPDYPSIVLNFFESAFENDSGRAISMIIYILEDLKKSGTIDETELIRYPVVKAIMEKREYADLSTVILSSITDKFLEIKELPDDFYYDLQDEVNRTFSVGSYVSVDILIRKILENLLVDILRKKFDMVNVDMFYSTTHRRFHGFNHLVKNFSDNLDSFKHVIPSLNSDFIQKLNLFRETGNSSAHTLEIFRKEKDLIDKKEDMYFTIKTLVRLFLHL